MILLSHYVCNHGNFLPDINCLDVAIVFVVLKVVLQMMIAVAYSGISMHISYILCPFRVDAIAAIIKRQWIDDVILMVDAIISA